MPYSIWELYGIVTSASIVVFFNQEDHPTLWEKNAGTGILREFSWWQIP